MCWSVCHVLAGSLFYCFDVDKYDAAYDHACRLCSIGGNISLLCSSVENSFELRTSLYTDRTSWNFSTFHIVTFTYIVNDTVSNTKQVDRMLDTRIGGVEFWAINTDAQALGRSKAKSSTSAPLLPAVSAPEAIPKSAVSQRKNRARKSMPWFPERICVSSPVAWAVERGVAPLP